MSRKFGRSADDVKVSVNLSPVALGLIDVLKGSGYHSTRSDLIRQAVSSYLTRHQTRIDSIVGREGYFVGRITIGRHELETALRDDHRMSIRCIGVVTIAPDVTPDLADRAIESIKVSGVLSAPRKVLEQLGSRVRRG